jgi:hypothetical protein
MLEKHGRLMNAGQPDWEDRILGIVTVSEPRDATPDFLDSLSEEVQAPYLSVPSRDADSTRSRCIREDINEKG